MSASRPSSRLVAGSESVATSLVCARALCNIASDALIIRVYQICDRLSDELLWAISTEQLGSRHIDKDQPAVYLNANQIRRERVPQVGNCALIQRVAPSMWSSSSEDSARLMIGESPCRVSVDMHDSTKGSTLLLEVVHATQIRFLEPALGHHLQGDTIKYKETT